MSAPGDEYRLRLEAGELAFQRCGRCGRAVFYPRVGCPRCGSRELRWERSGGSGILYSITVIHPRDGEPHNVVLVDLDEGFRMMSRLVGPEWESAAIGDPVRARIEPAVPGGPEARVVFARSAPA